MTTSKWAVAAGVLLAVGLCGGTAWLARSSAMPDEPTPVTKPVEPSAKARASRAARVSRMGSAQFRHGEAVFFIAYTADGKHIITAGRDNTIRCGTARPGRRSAASSAPRRRTNRSTPKRRAR